MGNGGQLVIDDLDIQCLDQIDRHGLSAMDVKECEKKLCPVADLLSLHICKACYMVL